MRSELRVAPDKAALLCIDLQEEHRRDERYLVAGFDTILTNVHRLQTAARARGVPVFHAAYAVDVAAGVPRPFHPVMADGLSAFSNKNDPLSAICPEVAPAGDERVFTKSAASTFADGTFAAHLKTSGIEWLLVAGVWTEACIDATVKDAIDAGIHVLLVKDACGSGSVAMHQTAVLNLANRLYGGAVATTGGANRIIEGKEADVWMVEGSVRLRFTFENAATLYAEL